MKQRTCLNKDGGCSYVKMLTRLKVSTNIIKGSESYEKKVINHNASDVNRFYHI